MATTLKKTGNKVKDMRLHFWKENKIANHYILAKEEFKEKFLAWLKLQKNEWLRYYGWNLATIVQCFVSAKDGLYSIGNTDNDQYDRMYILLKETRDNYLTEHNLWD